MNDPSQLVPAPRRAAFARLSEEVFDVVVIGGGATGTGSALGCRHARPARRAGRGARLRLGHLVALAQAGPRRACAISSSAISGSCARPCGSAGCC